MASKKQQSNLVGYAILGALAFALFQFAMQDSPNRITTSTQKSVVSATRTPAVTAPVALDVPRFVNVASLNVRHAPSETAELITALARGTPLRVLDRQHGWLLVDLSPTLEGWVTERYTTTQTPKKSYLPPARL